MSRLSKIKNSNPELVEDTDFKELLESADKIHAIKVIAEQEGGKELIEFLLTQVVNNVHVLTGRYQEATHQELIATIARMGANLAVVRFLTTAKGDVEELDRLIAEKLRE